MTVKEVSEKTGVSIRTLHYYDEIELLNPSERTETGYRIYGERDLKRLWTILMYREIGFPLKQIAEIMDAPGYDQNAALDRQISFLTLQKDRLENLIQMAEEVRKTGGTRMNFDAFNKKKMQEYEAEAKNTWGNTDAYREYEQKSKGRSDEKQQALGMNLMGLIAEFGQMLTLPADDSRVQAQVEKLRAFISENYYACTPEILSGLGEMYVSGGEMTENIEKAGGKGTAELIQKAIRIYCKR